MQDLTLFGDPELNGNMYVTYNGGDVSDNRILKLGDTKKNITLLAPSTSECSLWVKRITEARRKFVENERSRLQRQRSSKLK